MHIYTNKDIQLKTPATIVPIIDDDFRSLIDQVAEEMYAHNGVGIASTQIGDNRRFLIVDKSGGNVASAMRVLIDPVIVSSSKEENTDVERCLSFPGRSVNVKRSNEVTVSYVDLNGTKHETLFQGFEARIVQHEIDHINGITMLDRARK